MPELRRTCTFLGLDSKGTKSELERRIRQYQTGESSVATAQTSRCLSCSSMVERCSICLNCRFAAVEPYQSARCLQHWKVNDNSLSFETPASNGRLELRCLRTFTEPDDGNKLYLEAWPKKVEVVVSKDALAVDPHKTSLPPLPPGTRVRLLLKEADGVAKADISIGLVEVKLDRDLDVSMQTFRSNVLARERPCSWARSNFKSRFLASDWIELNLMCPYSGDRVVLPVRSKHCLHAQCFDLDHHLQACARMHQACEREHLPDAKPYMRRWTCPRCNASARPDELEVDAFVKETAAACDKATVYISRDLEVSRTAVASIIA